MKASAEDRPLGDAMTVKSAALDNGHQKQSAGKMKLSSPTNDIVSSFIFVLNSVAFTLHYY